MSRLDFELSVATDHPSLAGHFPGNPVVPGVLLLDCVLHVLQQSVGRPLARLRHVKFLSTLLPGESVRGHWEMDGARADFSAWVQRRGGAVKVAEGSVTLAAEGGA